MEPLVLRGGCSVNIFAMADMYSARRLNQYPAFHYSYRGVRLMLGG